MVFAKMVDFKGRIADTDSDRLNPATQGVRCFDGPKKAVNGRCLSLAEGTVRAENLDDEQAAGDGCGIEAVAFGNSQTGALA